ncbi:MAG: hypothetical protein JNK81_07320 [Anaerolineales bacterium]|nr:hypothetical protein [Anaerolineales bacterium]
METLVAPIDIIGKDPFGRFLEKIKIKPWQAGLLSLSWFLIYMVLLAMVFDAFFPRIGLEKNSIEDRVNQVGFWIVHPVIIFFYVWQPHALSKLYNIVIPLAPQSMRQGLVRSSQILHRNRNWWMIGTLVGAFVVMLGFMFVQEYIGTRWYSINWLMAILLQVSRFALLYMIMIIIIRHLLCAANINRIYLHVTLPILVTRSRFSNAFDAITSYGFQFAGLCAVLGLFIAMRFLYSIPVFPEDLIYLFVYIFLVPFSFTLPFWQAHVSMRLAREKAIHKISDELQDEYDRLLTNLSTEQDNTRQENHRVQALRAMLELTEKAPTWPFANWTIYRVFAATALTFVMTGLGYVFEFFL